MKVVIQIASKDKAKAWDILVRHSAGIALRNRIFIVSQEAARALKKARVKFDVIATDGVLEIPKGGLVGKRI
ncbi:MAG: hypothetical protein L0215_10640 [Gemmataceae bacterium]|nr:hypothetical protein [Gemmataceae bacterium]